MLKEEKKSTDPRKVFTDGVSNVCKEYYSSPQNPFVLMMDANRRLDDY